MLTRRQKNSIRGFTAALSSVALLSGFLIYTNISNTEKTDVVVFSDILEGAVAYSDGDDDYYPAVTLAEEELMETMFSEQYATFTLTNAPDHSVTYISPTAVNTGLYIPEPDESGDSDDTSASDDSAEVPSESSSESPGLPDNPNEITLLQDDLNIYRTEESSDTTTSAVTTSTETEASSGSQPASAATVTTTTATTAERTLPYTRETPYFMTTGTYQSWFTFDTTAATSSANTTTSVENELLYTTTTTRAETTTTTTTTTAPPTTATTTSATTVTTKAKTTATPANTTSHTSKTPFTNIGGGVFSEDDNIYLTLFKLVNDARREAGLNELWYSARVHEVCELRASELSSYYSHNRPDGSRFSTAFKEIGIKFDKCGENIAYGRNMFDTPEEVFQAWMDSDSHRENILSPDYECVAFGLSILKVGNDTYYYWTQEFAKF